MIKREDFADDEWQLLLDLPVLAGFLVSVASESGPFGTMRETVEAVEAVARAARQFPTSTLVLRLAADFEQSRSEAAAGATASGTGDDASDPDRFRADVIEKCRSACALLAVKASEPEGRDYRRWVIAVARSVALASKEGGFLGIGGRRVSPEEGSTLAELAGVLGLPPEEAAGEVGSGGSH